MLSLPALLDFQTVLLTVGYYALWAAALWYGGWLVIWLLTGFHISRVYYRGGVVILRLTVKAGPAKIKVGLLRLRLFGPAKLVVIDDVDVVIDESKRRKRRKLKLKASCTLEDIVPDELKNSVFPKHKWGRKAVETLLNHVPTLDVQVRLLTITLRHTNVIHRIVVRYWRALVLLRPLKRCADSRKYTVETLLLGLEYTTDTRTPISVLLVKVRVSTLINRKLGAMLAAQVVMQTDELKFSVFALIKLVVLRERLSKMKKLKKLKRGELRLTPLGMLLALLAKLTLDSLDDHEKHWHKLAIAARVLDLVSEVVSEVTLTCQNTRITDIPYLTMDHNYSYEQYFAKDVALLYLHVCAQTISISLNRILDNDAGFEILFSAHHDRPLHVSVVLQLITVDYITREGERLAKHGGEIINVPNLLMLAKTLILQTISRLVLARASHLDQHALEALTDAFADSEVCSQGLSLGVLECFLNLTNPMVDVTLKQIAELIYNLTIASKLSVVNKLLQMADYNGDSEVGELDDNVAAAAKQLLIRALHANLPRLDIRAVIEKPRFLMRLTALINFSFELFDLDIQRVPGIGNDYAKLMVLAPLMTIYKDRKPRYELFHANRIAMHAELQGIRLEPVVELDKVRVNLSELESLKVVHALFEVVSDDVQHHLANGNMNKEMNSILDEKLSRELACVTKEEVEAATVDSLAKVFDYMPLWLIGAKFSVNSLSVELGLRSVLIPKLKIGLTDDASLRSDWCGDDKKLRSAKLTLENFEVVLINGFLRPGVKPQLHHPKLGPQADLNVTIFWRIEARLKKLEVGALTLLPLEGGDPLHHPFLHIAGLELVTALTLLGKENLIWLDSALGNIDIHFDRYILFTLIGVVHVFFAFVFNPLRQMQKKLKRDLIEFDNNALEIGRREAARAKINPLDILKVRVTLDMLDFILSIDHGVELRTQMAQLKLLIYHGDVSVVVAGTRVLTLSPTVPKHWARLLYIDQLAVELPIGPLPPIKANCRQLRMLHPHQFVPYKVFDALLIFFKIIKHYARAIKNHDDESEDLLPREVFPRALPAIKLPPIELTTPSFLLVMEDDPFEQELGMCYQLGLTEQRKRLELMLLFEVKQAQGETVLEQELYALQLQISRLWVRKVEAYKRKLTDETVANQKYLYGNEGQVFSNHSITPYSIHAPLMKIQMDGVMALVDAPLFGIENTNQFIHDRGQGQPVDMQYTTLVPMFATLLVQQARVHLRDYPLALLLIPPTADGLPAFTVRGNLVVGEQFENTPIVFRRIYCSFIAGHADESLCGSRRNYFGLVVNKTLTPVKLFSDLGIHITSAAPARFIWGTSYNFALQQMGQNFDQFSKPPLDPSPKIGSWDKMKLMVHGLFNVKVDKAFEVAFKGLRDPYNVFQTAAGFMLLFEDHMDWDVNPDDDLRLFLSVKAGKVLWYIPNYLLLPLLLWVLQYVVWLPQSTEVVTLGYAYYLIKEAQVKNIKTIPPITAMQRKVVQLSGGIDFTLGFLLERRDAEGNISTKCINHWEVQLHHPDYAKEGHDSYAGWRLDYVLMKIAFNANQDTLYNTIHMLPGTMRAIMAWWHLFALNMMLPIKKSHMFGENQLPSPKFSQYLVANIFEFHVRLLWAAHIFRDDAINVDNYDEIECVGLRGMIDEFVVDFHQKRTPQLIRHATLDEEKKVYKMQFNIGEIHLNEIDLRTMRAKFKQDAYLTYDALQGGANANSEGKVKFKTFDDDQRWFDVNDYEETDTTTLSNTPVTAEALPILYTRKFLYVRDTGDSGDDELDRMLGDDAIHRCLIRSQNIWSPQIAQVKQRLTTLRNSKEDTLAQVAELEAELAQLEQKKTATGERLSQRLKSGHIHVTPVARYNNQFILVQLFFKYNEQVRNDLLRYVQYVLFYSKLLKYVDWLLIRKIDDMIDAEIKLQNDAATVVLGAHGGSLPIKKFTHKFTRAHLYSLTAADMPSVHEEPTAQVRLDHFGEILRDIGSQFTLSEDYYIEVINPQFQLALEVTKDAAVLVASPQIMCQIALVYDAKDKLANKPNLETRYGVKMADALIFVVTKLASKHVSKGLLAAQNSYGTKTLWPPWLGYEVFKDPDVGLEQLLVKNLDVMFTFEKLGDMLTYNEDEVGGCDRMNLDIPQLVITLTLDQYFKLLLICLLLFSYLDPLAVATKAKLEKIELSSLFLDLEVLRTRMVELDRHHAVLQFLERNYYFRQGSLDNSQLNDYIFLRKQLAEMLHAIFFTMQLILNGGHSAAALHTKTIQKWHFQADEIILHLLENDRRPLVDVAFAKNRFTRSIYENGLNENRIDIAMMQTFNLLPKSKCPMVLSPYTLAKAGSLDGTTMILAEWKMHRLVGGIRVIEQLLINLQPLLIMLDELTLERMLHFALQTDLDQIKSLPVLQKAAQKEEARRARQKAESPAKTPLPLLSQQLLKYTRSGPLSVLDDEPAPDIEEMMLRSKAYFSVEKLRVSPLTVLVLIKLRHGVMRLLNVLNFVVRIPEFIVRQEVMSVMEIGNRIKREVIRALLGHLGSLLRNKVTPSNIKSKNKAPLQQIQKYTGYIDVDELRSPPALPVQLHKKQNGSLFKKRTGPVVADNSSSLAEDRVIVTPDTSPETYPPPAPDAGIDHQPPPAKVQGKPRLATTVDGSPHVDPTATMEGSTLAPVGKTTANGAANGAANGLAPERPALGGVSPDIGVMPSSNTEPTSLDIDAANGIPEPDV